MRLLKCDSPVAGSLQIRSWIASQYGRVSTSSCSSIPARGDPTTFGGRAYAFFVLVFFNE